MFDCIEQDIISFCGDANLLICWDLNARVGTNPDLIVHDDSKFLPFYSNYPIDKNIMCRHNMDTKVDSRGNELLDFCISHQLGIPNGRTLGDLNGNFTCFTPNGASVSENALDTKCPHSFQLYRIAIAKLSGKYLLIFNQWKENENEYDNLHQIPTGYIWSYDSAMLYQKALTSESIQPKLKLFLDTCEINSVNEVNQASEQIANIFIDAAELSLKIKAKLRKVKTKTFLIVTLRP